MQKEMTYIESLEFSAQMNVCSGFTTILSGLQTEEVVKTLLEFAKDDWTAQFRIAYRIMELVKVSGDERYEHPKDVSLTTYLFVLEQSNRALALTCSILVNEAPRCFWAWRMVKDIQDKWNALYGHTATLQSHYNYPR